MSESGETTPGGGGKSSRSKPKHVKSLSKKKEEEDAFLKDTVLNFLQTTKDPNEIPWSDFTLKFFHSSKTEDLRNRYRQLLKGDDRFRKAHNTLLGIPPSPEREKTEERKESGLGSSPSVPASAGKPKSGVDEENKVAVKTSSARHSERSQTLVAGGSSPPSHQIDWKKKCEEVTAELDKTNIRYAKSLVSADNEIRELKLKVEELRTQRAREEKEAKQRSHDSNNLVMTLKARIQDLETQLEETRVRLNSERVIHREACSEIEAYRENQKTWEISLAQAKRNAEEAQNALQKKLETARLSLKKQDERLNLSENSVRKVQEDCTKLRREADSFRKKYEGAMEEHRVAQETWQAQSNQMETNLVALEKQLSKQMESKDEEVQVLLKLKEKFENDWLAERKRAVRFKNERNYALNMKWKSEKKMNKRLKEARVEIRHLERRIINEFETEVKLRPEVAKKRKRSSISDSEEEKTESPRKDDEHEDGGDEDKDEETEQDEDHHEPNAINDGTSTIQKDTGIDLNIEQPIKLTDSETETDDEKKAKTEKDKGNENTIRGNDQSEKN